MDQEREDSHEASTSKKQRGEFAKFNIPALVQAVENDDGHLVICSETRSGCEAVFRSVAERLREDPRQIKVGVDFGWEDVRDKWQVLPKQYKKQRKAGDGTLMRVPEFLFYEKILRKKDVSDPRVHEPHCILPTSEEVEQVLPELTGITDFSEVDARRLLAPEAELSDIPTQIQEGSYPLRGTKGEWRTILLPGQSQMEPLSYSDQARPGQDVPRHSAN